jgi:acetyl esterase/lipase
LLSPEDLWSGLTVALRRVLRGPLLPSWNLQFEASTHYQKAIYKAVYGLAYIEDSRELVDALVVQVPSLEKVSVKPVDSPVRGDWYRPEASKTDRVILYCHGAYAFYATAEKGFIADIAVITGLPVFAIDYRLTPENCFPAQLEDALASYDWLLELGFRETDIIVMGTSAGGNLCLSLLLELRDSKRPLPKLAVGLCPWTDIGNSGESIDENERSDTLDRSMIETGAKWFIGDDSPQDPRISPIHADLRGLPVMYLQAGGREIFIDMIRSFYEKAKSQGVDIELDVWESMNHVFQAYGDQLPEAREAMQRIAAVLHQPL